MFQKKIFFLLFFIITLILLMILYIYFYKMKHQYIFLNKIDHFQDYILTIQNKKYNLNQDIINTIMKEYSYLQDYSI